MPKVKEPVAHQATSVYYTMTAKLELLLNQVHVIAAKKGV